MMSTGTRLLDRDGCVLNIVYQGGGKLILLIAGIGEAVTDGFTVGLAPASLAELRAAAGAPAFVWEHRDGSLRINASGGAWHLTFVMNEPPYGNRALQLTEPESKQMAALLLGRGGR
jgi:hypothetical protein